MARITEIDAIEGVISKAIQLDPSKRHVVLVNYNTSTLYIRHIEEKWEEVTGNKPIVILQRPDETFRVFEVPAHEAHGLEKGQGIAGVVSGLGVHPMPAK